MMRLVLEGVCLQAVTLMRRKKAWRFSVLLFCGGCNALFCVIVASASMGDSFCLLPLPIQEEECR